MRVKDLTGKTFNGNTVLAFAGTNGRKSIWKARCRYCGNTFLIESSEIHKARQKSCGCMKRKLIGQANTHHGMSNTPIWNVWHSMKERCEVPTAQAWKNYGGRGIQVCRRWSESFEAFLADMGPTYQKGLTLDRIDVNGDYSPENCRWATRKEQNRNKRGNRYINTPKGRMTFAEASDTYGIGVTTILYRLERGVPEDLLLVKPDVRNLFTTSGMQVRGTVSM